MSSSLNTQNLKVRKGRNEQACCKVDGVEFQGRCKAFLKLWWYGAGGVGGGVVVVTAPSLDYSLYKMKTLWDVISR